MNVYSESLYPTSYREEESVQLADHIRHFRNVELVGMKRVGISNFLRYFLYNPKIFKKLFTGENNNIFIAVDLLDLVERETFPFWILTLKRIDDAVQSSKLNAGDKRTVFHLFEKAILSKDVFITLDSIRSALRLITRNNFQPTIFFIRFDRITDFITPEMFGNLQGLINAADHKLSYVFTSVRRLHNLRPDVFKRAEMSVFSQPMFLQHANLVDSEIIFSTLKKKYNLKIGRKLQKEIFNLCRGHVQYLQLFLIVLSELRDRMSIDSRSIKSVLRDERIVLQSEELYSSLLPIEREAFKNLLGKEKISKKLRQEARYIWNVGIVDEDGGFWSPLFKLYVENHLNKTIKNGEHFLTKKENILFKLLSENEGKLCERDVLFDKVWPEYSEIGISDWAVDRLVARLRKKLQVMKSEYKIHTIKTRGFLMKKEINE